MILRKYVRAKPTKKTNGSKLQPYENVIAKVNRKALGPNAPTHEKYKDQANKNHCFDANKYMRLKYLRVNDFGFQKPCES